MRALLAALLLAVCCPAMAVQHTFKLVSHQGVIDGGGVIDIAANLPDGSTWEFNATVGIEHPDMHFIHASNYSQCYACPGVINNLGGTVTLLGGAIAGLQLGGSQWHDFYTDNALTMLDTIGLTYRFVSEFAQVIPIWERTEDSGDMKVTRFETFGNIVFDAPLQQPTDGELPVVSHAPEPETYALMLLGLGVLFGRSLHANAVANRGANRTQGDVLLAV